MAAEDVCAGFARNLAEVWGGTADLHQAIALAGGVAWAVDDEVLRAAFVQLRGLPAPSGPPGAVASFIIDAIERVDSERVDSERVASPPPAPPPRQGVLPGTVPPAEERPGGGGTVRDSLEDSRRYLAALGKLMAGGLALERTGGDMGEGPHRCVCRRRYPTQRALNVHMTAHYPPGARAFHRANLGVPIEEDT